MSNSLIGNGNVWMGNSNNTSITTSSLNVDLVTTDKLEIYSEYLNFIAEILELPSFDEFENMSKQDKKTLIRDIKINKILK